MIRAAALFYTREAKLVPLRSLTYIYVHVCEFAGRLSGAPSRSLSNNRIVCKWLRARMWVCVPES